MESLRTGLTSAALIGLLAAPVGTAAQQAKVLTLAQAIGDALVKSDQAINQRDAIQQAALGLKLARNGFTPKIVPNISGSFGQTDVSNQTYRLDLAVHKLDGYPYDYHRLLYSFRVKSRSRDVGIYSPDHQWSFSPNIHFKTLKADETE